MNPFLDESVVDEIVFCFGRKCFWMSFFFFFRIWMKVYLTKFGVLITAGHKVLNEGCESKDNHQYAVEVQHLATQWIQFYPCITNSRETEKSVSTSLEPSKAPK